MKDNDGNMVEGDVEKDKMCIRDRHKALKTQTARHLLNIKKVCTPEQSKKLEKMFIDLLEINKHCSECAEKCTDQEKCKRCNKFQNYKNIESDPLEINKDSIKNVEK